MRLIDLDKAIESMAKLEQEDNEAYGVSIPECFDSNRAIKALNNIPTVQAVPLSECQELEDKFKEVCVALIAIMNEECCSYGFEEASDIAENYLAQTD